MPKFAEGGVSDRPSIFGEAGPEAAVPLSRGRAIPVELRVPRFQPVAAANFNQPAPVFAPNIIAPPGYVAQTREVDDGRGGRKPEISFAEVTARAIRSPPGAGGPQSAEARLHVILYWPSDLPQRVLADSFSETLADGRLRTAMETGHAKSRRRFSSAPKPSRSRSR